MYTNRHNLPKFLFNALTYSEYPQHDANTIGVTTLIDSPLKHRLVLEHTDEIVTDAMDLVAVTFGTAFHNYVEAHAGPDVLLEQRMEARVGDYTISGQVDVIDEDVIYDIKTTSASAWMYGMKDSWNRQVNVYRWLSAQNGIEISKLYIAMLFKDWSQGNVKRMERNDYDYPDAPVKIVEIPIMPDVGSYIHRRVGMHFDTCDPVCSAEDRWQKDAKYAVHYAGRYKAERLLDTMEDAARYVHDLGNSAVELPVYTQRVSNERGFYIYKRREEWIRCERNYCPVTRWCPQYQEFRHANGIVG